MAMCNMATPSENATSTWRTAGNGSVSEYLRLKHDCNFEMENEASNQFQKGRFEKLKPNERLRPEAPGVGKC